jgi:DNA-binding MarR family transcriptional regulator
MNIINSKANDTPTNFEMLQPEQRVITERLADLSQEFQHAAGDELISPKSLETMTYASFVKRLYNDRRKRENHFSPELFSNPAWDIFLELFLATEEARTIQVTSLCIASSVPKTTAIRWITALTKNGYLHRKADIFDGRRALIALTPLFHERFRDYLSEMAMRWHIELVSSSMKT